MISFEILGLRVFCGAFSNEMEQGFRLGYDVDAELQQQKSHRGGGFVVRYGMLMRWNEFGDLTTVQLRRKSCDIPGSI
ncbi:hypothetical protein IIK97_004089 [Salmonella enterica subsp. enterica serovar Nigeria]|nr:hypothetical protein [Salmonella enterica subsp. enterica serovar Nigeria]